MGKRLAIVAILVFVLGFEVGYAVFASIPSWENARFTIKVAGPVGTEFEGFCTHEVKYLTGSRTEVTPLQGKITADKNAFEFDILETEFSGNINSTTPGENITVTYVRDGVEGFNHEGTAFYFGGN
jgi:hypothetical protein